VSTSIQSIRAELAPTLRIAVPVVLAELGWMAMGVVDTIMVGPLGPTAISAVGVGVAIHMGFAVFGMGMLLGLDTLVSRAFGARDFDECHRWLFHGVALALLMTLPIMLLCVAVLVSIPSLGFHPLVMPYLQGYFSALLWSTPMLLLYAAFRRYLQGMHIVTPVMFALVSSNVMNAVFNWVLVYGHLGFPAMGVIGSAWATVIARTYMAAILAIAIWRHYEFRGSSVHGFTGSGVQGFPPSQPEAATARPRRSSQDALASGGGQGFISSMAHGFRGVERARLWKLVQLGFPAASQITAEVGVFALATALAGTLDPISSASHQIALNLAGVAFMVPLGISSAGAVRVGHAIGANDPARAAASGWTAILIGTLFMTASGLLFFVVPRQLIGLFSTDTAVLDLGSSLLYLAAVFQLFDGIQGVATGTLRGLGDTRTPMIVNLWAHWLVGLPVSYSLCFIFGWGVQGLWIGLSLGLIVTGVILLRVWNVKIRQYLLAAQTQ
jgi:multidrug resistance protein, MATE family